MEVVKQSASYTEFRKHNESIYRYTLKTEFIDRVKEHFGIMGGSKYSPEIIKNIALKCKSYNEFRESSPGAYTYACKNNLLSIIQNILPLRRDKKYSKNILLDLAKKCESYTEFCKKNEGAYRYARENNYLSFIKEILPPKVKPVGFWNKSNCIKYAKKCSSKIEFRSRYRTAYENCLKNNWKDEAFSHMVDPRKGRVAHNYKWDKSTIAEEALKYDSRSDFEKNAPGAYKTASSDGYLDEICSHMRIVGHRYKRAIYAIEFSDKSVYVGLTYDFKQRQNSHLRNSNNKFVRERFFNNVDFKIVKFDEWFPPDIAVIKEKETIDLYIENGFNVLNIAKVGRGGSVGGRNLKWNKTSVLKAAKQCKSPSQFKKEFNGAWAAAHRNGYINNCYSHMQLTHKPNGYYNDKDNCKKESMKYKKRSHFKKHCPAGYASAGKNGWLDEFFSKIK